MKHTVIGYVGTLVGAVLALLVLASLGDAKSNLLVTAVLAILDLCAFGVGWYFLSGASDRAAERSAEAEAEAAPPKREAA